MAFVASPSYTGLVSGALPMMRDVGGSTDAVCPFSHMRIVGAGTVTFDTGQTSTSAAGVDTVIPVPPAAKSFTISGGTPTVQLGQSI